MYILYVYFNSPIGIFYYLLHASTHYLEGVTGQPISGQTKGMNPSCTTNCDC